MNESASFSSDEEKLTKGLLLDERIIELEKFNELLVELSLKPKKVNLEMKCIDDVELF